jgi:hypothetical protein
LKGYATTSHQLSACPSGQLEAHSQVACSQMQTTESVRHMCESIRCSPAVCVAHQIA